MVVKFWKHGSGEVAVVATVIVDVLVELAKQPFVIADCFVDEFIHFHYFAVQFLVQISNRCPDWGDR